MQHLRELYTIIDLKESGSSIWWSSAYNWYEKLPELQKSMALEIYLEGGLKSSMDDVGGDEPENPGITDLEDATNVVDLDDDTTDIIELLESGLESVSDIF